MPAPVGRSAYGIITAVVFTWNRNTIDMEDKYNKNMKIMERSARAGIR